MSDDLRIPDGPVLTRHADESVTISWPNGRPEWFAVTPEALESLVAEHNANRAAVARVEALCDEAEQDANDATDDYEGFPPEPVVKATFLRRALRGDQ